MPVGYTANKQSLGFKTTSKGLQSLFSLLLLVLLASYLLYLIISWSTEWSLNINSTQTEYLIHKVVFIYRRKEEDKLQSGLSTHEVSNPAERTRTHDQHAEESRERRESELTSSPAAQAPWKRHAPGEP